jgi:hypothetical protein
MMRKMLLIASAVAIPLGAIGVTAVAGSTMAGASNSTLLAITCHITGATVTFATPGLSQDGSISASSSSTTTTSAQALNCGTAGTGSSPALSIVTASTPCTTVPTPPACVGQPPADFNYDSTAGFSSSGGTLAASIPKIKFKIKTTSYTSKTTSSAGTVCTGGELGFVLKGKLTAPAAHAGEATKVTACLGADTGTGTTGSFTADFGQPGVTIATAALAADSKAKIS